MTADVLVEDGEVVRSAGPAGDVPWWSFSKTVIAAAALALVRDGRLTLDRPLAGRPWTLRQLLQHRAGLGNYGDLAAYHAAVARNEQPWTPKEMLARCTEHPSAGWRYSNIGYLFVRRLIEEATGDPLDASLSRLVLRPLEIDNVRLATERADLVTVAMGTARGYHPGWVYHGLLVGPLPQACLLLQRLLTGPLLPAELRAQMLHRHPVGGPIAGRPWIAPGYGLGLMTGTVIGGAMLAGHTGGGPGSVVAVYHQLSSTPARTAAAFSFGDDQGAVEAATLTD